MESCGEDLAPWGEKFAGRECRKPFLCLLADDCECPLGGCNDCSVGADGATCTVCRDDRYLVEGKCKKDITCKGSKYLETGDKCGCKFDDEVDCHTCEHTGGAGNSPVKTCTRCKNSKYFLAGRCVEASECPTGLVPAGASSYGRLCTAPFTCKNGKALDGSEEGKKCTCDTANCHTCVWSESGSKCTRCKSKTYLHDGACVDSCPASLTGFGAGSSGRYCADGPVACRSKKDPQGVKCKCNDSKNCKHCEFVPGKARSVCTQCQDKTDVIDADGECQRAPVTTTTATTTTTTTAAQMNIVVFMPDDMKFLWDEAPLAPDAGEAEVVPTPHMNRIREEGAVFTKAYTAGPKCAPARYAILSGRYCSDAQFATDFARTTTARTYVEVPSCKLDGESELSSTVPQALKELGYRTIHSGKYHLLNGGSWSDYEGTITSVKKAGFTDDGGTWYSNMNGDLPFSFSHNLEWAVNKSLTAVDSALDNGEPFFLYFAATVPHNPNLQDALALSPKNTPAGILDDEPVCSMPGRDTLEGRVDVGVIEDRRARRTAVSKAIGTVWFDDAVGAILGHLEDEGVLDDTLVISMMDHGMSSKNDLYEGGVRISHAVRYPK